jgi:hypothetical protein
VNPPLEASPGTAGVSSPWTVSTGSLLGNVRDERPVMRSENVTVPKFTKGYVELLYATPVSSTTHSALSPPEYDVPVAVPWIKPRRVHTQTPSSLASRNNCGHFPLPFFRVQAVPGNGDLCGRSLTHCQPNCQIFGWQLGLQQQPTGGGVRIRTGVRGFAGPCLTTRPRRQK